MSFNAFWTPRRIAEITAGRWVVAPSDAVAAPSKAGGTDAALTDVAPTEAAPTEAAPTEAAPPDAAPPGMASPLTGLSIDTRTLRSGQVYLAIRGERFDGHDFVEQAFEAGAGMAIVAREPPEVATHPAPVLMVEDTLIALHALAAVWRDVLSQWGCRVIAVAGSNGKTTTRRLIHHVLTAGGLVGTQSPKSFNNHIGVPLTLLNCGLPNASSFMGDQPSATADPPSLFCPDGVSGSQTSAADPVGPSTTAGIPQFCVVEIGTNHPGEVKALARIVRPDVAVITSIGQEHLEYFGDRDGVIREELSVTEHIRPHGLLVMPDYLLTHEATPAFAGHLKVKTFSLGMTIGGFPELPEPLKPRTIDPADLRLAGFTGYDEYERYTLFDLTEGTEWGVSLIGEHNVHNAMACILVARHFEVPDPLINDGLKTMPQIPGRMQLLHVPDGPLVIHDAYNANPSSMAAALSTLRWSYHRFGMYHGEGHHAWHVAILGDMLELGEHSMAAHQQLAGDLADVSSGVRDSEVNVAILVGEQTRYTAGELKRYWTPQRYHHYETLSRTTCDRIAAMLEPDDVVLLKGSRGMRLERMIPAIQARFGTR